jgi:hypothetical protein
MKMVVTQTINGYRFDLPEEHLKVKANRLHVHKDGKVTGELLISSNGATPELILKPHTQLNFSSDLTRTKLIKSLSEDSEHPWPDIIDQVCYQVLEFARAGEPLQQLWTSADVHPPEWYIKPIIIRGMPTVVFGEKGVLKSNLVLMLMTCLLLPWAGNPCGLQVPEESTQPLLLDWETEADVVQWSAKKLQQGMGLRHFALPYRRCYLPLADDLEQIQTYIEESKAKVIFIDSLAQAAGGELKETQPALAFFTALRQLKTTAFIVAQTSKTEEGKKTIYGNAIFTYYARNIFELSRSDDKEENTANIALFHRWSNVTKLSRPLGFQFTFNEGTTEVESQVVTVEEFRKKMSATAKILYALKRGPLSTKALMEECNLDRDEADQAVSRLTRRNKIVKLGDGTVGLSQS